MLRKVYDMRSLILPLLATAAIFAAATTEVSAAALSLDAGVMKGSTINTDVAYRRGRAGGVAVRGRGGAYGGRAVVAGRRGVYGGRAVYARRGGVYVGGSGYDDGYYSGGAVYGRRAAYVGRGGVYRRGAFVAGRRGGFVGGGRYAGRVGGMRRR